MYMIIIKNGDNVRIISDIVANAISNPEDYEQIDIIGNITGAYTTLEVPLIDNSNVIISGSTIDVKPSFFGLKDHIDGVYNFQIKYWKPDFIGYTLEANCAFIDILYKCKVASTLNALVKESKNESLEPTASMLHLLHYALVNGSNCNCNCKELNTAFRELKRILSGVDTQILEDCGC